MRSSMRELITETHAARSISTQGRKLTVPPLNRSDLGVVEVSFRSSVPKVKLALTVARSE